MNVPIPPKHTPRVRTRRRMIIIGAALAMIFVILVGWGASNDWFSDRSAARTPDGTAAVTSDLDPRRTDTRNTDPRRTDPEHSTPPPLDIPRPTPTPVAGAEESERAASAAAGALLAASNQVLQRGDGVTAGLDAVATGFVRGELEALAAERADFGYTQVGEATITSTTVRSSDLTASPPTVVLEVCIDTSEIDILDPNGNSMKDLLYNPGVPVKHIYGAQHLDGVWKISTHDIPDNSPCA